MERAHAQRHGQRQASGHHVLENEVELDDAKDHHHDHSKHGGVAAPLEPLWLDAPNKEQEGYGIDCGTANGG